MKKTYWIVVAFFLGVCVLFLTLNHRGYEPGSNRAQFINIGTGGLTGVYYPTGVALCRLLDRAVLEMDDFNVICSTEATGGSIFNLNTMASGDMSMAVVQSDWQYYAYQGSSVFSGRPPNTNLRALFSLQTEPFTVVARRDANINTFEDLRGKRVNIGDPGSGQYGNMEILMKAYGWTIHDFRFVSELKASEHAEALCDNRLDAFVYVIGHPNASIQEAATTCDVNLVPVRTHITDRLVEGSSFYVFTDIPGGVYRNNPNPTPTFGLKATIVAEAQVPDEVVYLLVKSVFENLDELRELHPAFKTLNAKQMLEGNSAPYHPGAARYYHEQGWLS